MSRGSMGGEILPTLRLVTSNVKILQNYQEFSTGTLNSSRAHLWS
jgi:hypothetical protein